MANQQGPASRQTKAQRKEQARNERLEIQRRMARAKRRRWIALGAVVVLAFAAGAFVLTRPKTAVADPADLLGRAADAKQSAGCGTVQDVGPYQPETQDRLHISAANPMPALSTYASVPPASGPHNPTPLGPGVYGSPPPIDQAIHSLEHGAAIVWYAPGTTGEQLDQVEAFYRQSSVGSRVIVAPYDYPDQEAAGQLPAGVQMALVAWHHVESCAHVNLAAAFNFTASYSAPTYHGRNYLGDAPEAGVAI
jgi:hypothetical protein